MLSLYKTYYGFLFRYKRRFAAFLLVVALAAIAGSIQPYFYKLFIDSIPRFSYRELFIILLAYVGVRLLELFASLISYILGDWVLIPAARDARLKVFKKIQDLDFAFHLSKSTGSLISSIKRGDGAFFSLFHAINHQLVEIAINFTVLLIVFSRVRLEIAGLMVGTLAVNLLLVKFLVKNNIEKRIAFNNSEDRISAIIVDNLINYETVKIFAKEEREYDRLGFAFEDWYKKLWGYANSFRSIDIIVGSLGNLGLFFVLMFALSQTSSKAFTPGEFVLILGFVSAFYPKFFELVYKFREIARQHADIERYFAILDNNTAVLDPAKPVRRKRVIGEIEFRNVTFSYPDSKKEALTDFDLKIKPGESVAFVGKSGVGKSTIVKLLMRFYDVNKGNIFIDGINIKRFTKSQLRSFMGVVPQEPVLFNDTIGFNIAYGADKPTRSRIQAAAKMAHLDEFINNLPEGYDTIVGERGVKLSGGQKQRLAIARMILSEPDIIIFDEATSQLDSESEKVIQDAFWQAARGKTTLIVAHRLSTVMRADRIVVMEKGRIKEVGTHKDLVENKDGLYRRFWNLQVEAY